MRSFHKNSLVAVGFTLALLTGCSGGNVAGPTVGGAIGPAALRRLLMPDIPPHGTGVAVHPFINFAAITKNKGNTFAISVWGPNVVDLFTGAGTQVAQLTGFDGPAGMASDVKGNLYVTDIGNSRVQIYAAGFATPPTTLSDPGESPLDVDSFANGAYVAVTNEVTTGDGPGSVSIFKGSTLQSNITYSNLGNAFFCAFDGRGNLYVDGLDPSGNSFVGEIRNVTSGGSTLEQLTTTNTIGFPGGIQVATAGQIAIEDAYNQAIYSYDPPSGGSLGTPAQITPLGGYGDPFTFAFTKDMTGLYAANPNLSDAFEYAYPTGGTPVSTIALSGEPFGTAVIPTQYPSSSR